MSTTHKIPAKCWGPIRAAEIAREHTSEHGGALAIVYVSGETYRVVDPPALAPNEMLIAIVQDGIMLSPDAEAEYLETL